ncbi:maleylacetate reductase [Herbiconiux moechotypicola]|uniref:Maleylacetate reductase n=1 Tax=Herbiconiux moechotypicola TaxID=637393 RepID=A0ABN3E3A5_9MICO|nr:maleylacetate reductase [Herbiconiux moechotypicola]MCS5731386.1 maleylacetate reductase [Herbiconiux moechotypicola]
MRFDHRTLAQRVRFGTGGATAAVAAEVADRGARAVMLVAGPGEAEIAAQVAEGIELAVDWGEVTPHVPAGLAERARVAARGAGVDLVVSVGGGSTTGLAKAIALTEHIPIVAVPTTYAGSEATNVWGITTDSRKTTGVDDAVLPACVVYDAELTLSLPIDLTVASGLNALAHCVDSMWAPNSDPIDRALAEEGIRTTASALLELVGDGSDLAARERMLFGAYVSAVAFASAGSGLHHKICHVLGGAYDLPHAATHTVVLPHVLAFNAPAAPEAETRIARALGATGAVSGLRALYERLPVAGSLAELGYDLAAVPESVELVLPLVPAGNPRAVDRDALTRILTAAWSGDHI